MARVRPRAAPSIHDSGVGARSLSGLSTGDRPLDLCRRSSSPSRRVVASNESGLHRFRPRCLEDEDNALRRQREGGPYDVRDIAAVAARALTEEGHEGKVYELTGPEAISNREIAEKLSAAVGKPVEHVEIPLEDAREAMIGEGAPEWLADGLVELNREVYEPGYAANVADGMAETTGREPRSFEEFARDHAGAFAETGSAL